MSSLFDWIRKPLVKYRLNTVLINTRNYYDAIVRHCCGVTKVNKDIAFAIYRVGVFKGPVVEQIRKPDNIELSEKNDCVIVKDGYVYELKKETR